MVQGALKQKAKKSKTIKKVTPKRGILFRFHLIIYNLKTLIKIIVLI